MGKMKMSEKPMSAGDMGELKKPLPFAIAVVRSETSTPEPLWI